MTIRAAIYARYSTDKQTESTIKDQVRVCTERAAQEGMRVVETYKDQGISGAAIANRPGVLRMIEDGLARKFEVLILSDASRLSRSTADLSRTVERLVFAGIRVIAIQDGGDTQREGWEIVFGFAGVMGQMFRRIISVKTRDAMMSRAKTKRTTGGRAYGYVPASQTAAGIVEVHPREAEVVRDIFARYAEGASCLTIARELNSRKVPSPGSSWKREERRASEWMNSAIRAMLQNPLYKGVVVYNRSEWRKNPTTGERKRIERPSKEWITHTDESLRIVSDDLWSRAQRATRKSLDTYSRIADPNDRAVYLLSGFLVCSVCGANYIMADKRAYACSSHHHGRACSNHIRIRRDRAEAVLINPIKDDLLAPKRISLMVKELQRLFAEHAKSQQARSDSQPKDLQELDARLARLRRRLQDGDEDLAADEIQVAIDRVEVKRKDLLRAQPEAKESAKVLAMLPRAADLSRQQIEKGLDGNPRAALKARVVLKDLFGGQIRLIPGEGNSLFAEYHLHPAALLRGADGYGSGGRI